MSIKLILCVSEPSHYELKRAKKRNSATILDGCGLLMLFSC